MSDTIGAGREGAPHVISGKAWPFRLASERGRATRAWRLTKSGAPNRTSPPDAATLRSAAADRLRDVVLTLMAAKPFHQVGMRDITKASGLSLSQIYALAASKDGLVPCCLEPAMETLLERLADASRLEVGARRRLTACLIELSRLAFEDERVGRILYLNAPRSLWIAAGGAGDGHDARRTALFEEIVRHGAREGSVRPDRSPAALTRLLLAAADGVIADHVARDTASSKALKPDWRARGAELIDLVWPMVSAD